ncbi:hypothetical protein DO71_2056 [Burkholderia pseudomallei]|nr:hypothetical protein DO71_2056 [Burkholderia pseudomallei]
MRIAHKKKAPEGAFSRLDEPAVKLRSGDADQPSLRFG